MPADPYAHGSYLIPQGGTPPIYFDCVTEETTTRESEVTEFPVEVGANISDHYRNKLTGVKFDVFVSQEPIDPSIHPDGAGFYGAQTLAFDKHPYPTRQLDLATVATAAINPVGLATAVVTAALNDLINGDPRAVTMNSVLQYPQQFDSLALLLVALDYLRATAGLLDIATRSAYYDGFVITSVTTVRDKTTGTGARVSIDFKRIVTVATQTTGAPPVPQKPKDKPPVNKGAQQPQDPGQMQSLASKGLDAIKAAAGF